MSRGSFFVVLTTLLGLVLVAGLALTSPYHLRGWYYRYFLGPELEEQYGFTVGERVLTEPGGRTSTYLVLASVAPDGPLGRAGARAGDIPLNCHHGCTYGFYAALLAAREHVVSHLRLLPADELHEQGREVREVLLLAPSAK